MPLTTEEQTLNSYAIQDSWYAQFVPEMDYENPQVSIMEWARSLTLSELKEKIAAYQESKLQQLQQSLNSATQTVENIKGMLAIFQTELE